MPSAFMRFSTSRDRGCADCSQGNQLCRKHLQAPEICLQLSPKVRLCARTGTTAKLAVQATASRCGLSRCRDSIQTTRRAGKPSRFAGAGGIPGKPRNAPPFPARSGTSAASEALVQAQQSQAPGEAKDERFDVARAMAPASVARRTFHRAGRDQETYRVSPARPDWCQRGRRPHPPHETACTRHGRGGCSARAAQGRGDGPGQTARGTQAQKLPAFRSGSPRDRHLSAPVQRTCGRIRCH
jgi:hypothetical protein